MLSKERRRFTRAFKLAALKRLEAAGHVGVLAAELGVRGALLYRWRRKYASGGAEALTTSGRPRPVAMAAGEVSLAESEAVSAAARVAGLERKIGQQQMELDFFRAALRRVGERRRRSGASGARTSTP